MKDIAAIILAAGMASRYRAADPRLPTKLVAEWRGLPLVRHVALAALASRARPLQVVTGHAATDVRAALAGLDVGFTHNPDYAAGLSTSLRTGLQAVAPQTAAAVILLADMPNVAPALIDRLVEAFAAAPDAAAVVPMYAGRRGNPVLLGRILFHATQRLEGDEGARRLLTGARVVEIEAAEPGVTLDVDDPDSLHRLGGG